MNKNTWFFISIVYLFLNGNIGSSAFCGTISSKEGDNLVSLQKCETIGLEQHSSIRLAQEDVQLAKTKKTEALRNIFPNLALKAEETNGKSSESFGTPDFTERSIGLEIGQTIFQGGILFKTYQQTEARLKSLDAKLSLSKQNVVFRVRESYWNLIRAYRVLDIYLRTITELEQEKTIVSKLLTKDVVSAQVYMTVNSQYNQTVLFLESAKADVEYRLWQWTQSLGLSKPPSYRPDLTTPVIRREDIRLDECISLALKSHPELKYQDSLVRAAKMGVKASKGTHWPRLDLNATYGKSGAAFKGEDLNMNEDWQIGLKLALNFGGNTTRMSALQQKTSPKIGQSSRTELETVSASIGILDDLKSKTDKKEAILNYHRAKTQRESNLMDVLNNVRESYSNWRKALSQLKIAENDLALSFTDLSVAEIKRSRREIPISEISITRSKLAKSEVSLAEAQSAYAISLAELNRSIGIKDKFNIVRNRSRGK